MTRPGSDYVFTVEVCGNCGAQITHEDDPCGDCGSRDQTTVRFRVQRGQLLKQVKPRQALIEASLYFGCWRESGHYYWTPGMGKVRSSSLAYEGVTPWGHHVDGGLFGRNVQPGVGNARTFHKDGWTALAFEDNSVDSRPGSWSVFCIPETLGYDDALAVAREAFPEVFARLTFEVRELDRIGKGLTPA